MAENEEYLRERASALEYSQPSWLKQIQRLKAPVAAAVQKSGQPKTKDILDAKLTLREVFKILAIALATPALAIFLFKISFLSGLTIFATLMVGILLFKSFEKVTPEINNLR